MELCIKDPYVDLGIPSGTLWATYNIGATMPEEYGYYFACGETESKVDSQKNNFHMIEADLSS